MNSLTIQAPAKINLFLKILGKRPDGYHELDTVMAKVDLFDTLRLEVPSQPGLITLRCRWDDPDGLCARSVIPEDERNLVVKAAMALREYVRRPELGIHAQLIKRIPAEAGLGGGSSDAAATLVGLNKIWKLNLPDQSLHEIAASLGSDINFFLSPTSLAVCSGRGERIALVPDFFPFDAVIIKPPGGLSTKEVFSAYHDAHETTSFSSQDLLTHLGGPLSEWSRFLFNSLQAPASACDADVRKILKHLSLLPNTHGIMTGSGSACVAFTSNTEEAIRLAAHLRSQHLGDLYTVRSTL